MGDAGKGFAVVASEVKELANQTERATLDIGERIGLRVKPTTVPPLYAFKIKEGSPYCCPTCILYSRHATVFLLWNLNLHGPLTNSS